jgi:hypothetical protein
VGMTRRMGVEVTIPQSAHKDTSIIPTRSVIR